MTSRIADDQRPINLVFSPNDDEDGSRFHYRVGYSSVTEIRSYLENGEREGVPWIEVVNGDHVAARVSAEHVVIVYAEPDADQSV